MLTLTAPPPPEFGKLLEILRMGEMK